MSIALHRNGGTAVRGGGGAPCRPIHRDRRRLEERDSDSCSSSSLGRNSDISGGSSEGEDSGDDEAQSSFKGPLDSMDALGEVLPIKRGMSKFYNGKSKSFTCLADAESATSAKAIAKPVNPYHKKRKNTTASHDRPPLHPQPQGKRSPLTGPSSPPKRQSPWRSFSLSDITVLAISGEGKRTETH